MMNIEIWAIMTNLKVNGDEHIMFMTMGMACEITMDMISMQP